MILAHTSHHARLSCFPSERFISIDGTIFHLRFQLLIALCSVRSNIEEMSFSVFKDFDKDTAGIAVLQNEYFL